MKCLICGAEFEPARHGQPKKYCSMKCRRAAYVARQRKLPPLPLRKCALCGAEFKPKRLDSKYCSRKCCNNAANRYSNLLTPREGKLKRRECENCGKTFETKSNEHFCSDACRIQYFHLEAW